MEKLTKSHPIYRITNIGLLAVAVFTYTLGIGIAHHLGARLDWTNLILGLLAVTFLLEMRNFLSAYFDYPDTPSSTLHRDDSLYSALKEVKRQALMQIALTVLTAVATITVILIFRHAFSAAGILLLGTAFMLCFFSASPPLRLEKSGYGELIEALVISALIPGIALTLQGKDLNYLFVMLSLPLTLIHLAMKIALSFEGYGHEIMRDSRSLVKQIGWQRAMIFHNILLIVAFVFIGIFGLLGLSWSFVWPMLLGLPVAVYEVFLILQIADGAKPRWRLLRLVAGGLYLLMTYLILITLWIR